MPSLIQRRSYAATVCVATEADRGREHVDEEGAPAAGGNGNAEGLTTASITVGRGAQREYTDCHRPLFYSACSYFFFLFLCFLLI
jgi:hypothetical protein